MSAENKKEPKCIDTRPCFAKVNRKNEVDKNGNPVMKCVVLTKSYKEDGQCPFCKTRAAFTNGVYYPNKRDCLA